MILRLEVPTTIASLALAALLPLPAALPLVAQTAAASPPEVSAHSGHGEPAKPATPD